jgi:hypothetical protein
MRNSSAPKGPNSGSIFANQRTTLGIYDQYNENNVWVLHNIPRDCRRIWYHIQDYEKLPPLPKELATPESSESAPTPPPTAEEMHMDDGNVAPVSTPPPAEAITAVDDTPMSEPEAPQESETPQDSEAPQMWSNMLEIDAASPPGLPVSGIIDDTEMGGTQDPPPPPPLDLPGM